MNLLPLEFHLNHRIMLLDDSTVKLGAFLTAMSLSHVNPPHAYPLTWNFFRFYFLIYRYDHSFLLLF